ncbi:MAG TPA: BTAD domain-containing putative transcriptional regulator [candidate division Zixibacteria bacterium]|nr:BTAD domain-containing putative transcriptional regulator [candidate division Zixibacteria bacterium]
MVPDLPPREALELAAHGATAVLATWLGLTVTVRSPASPATRAFGLITLFLTSWSLAVIVQRLSDVPLVDRVTNSVEDVAAFFVVAATPHIAIAVSAEGRWSGWQRLNVAAAYALALVATIPSVVNPEAKFAVTPPHFELAAIPGEVFGWAWIVIRIGLFATALGWIIVALRKAGGDVARRRQLQAALATVAVGALGGAVRFTPPLSDTDRWLGVSLVTLAAILATYAVFAQRIFFSAEVAGRTFRYSLIGALGVTAYVGLLVGADRLVRDALGIELPLVIAIGLVATVALWEPAAGLARRWILERTPREAAYHRLLRALGEPVLSAQAPAGSLHPALARLNRSFGLTGARMVGTDAQLIAADGRLDLDAPLGVRLPLVTDGQRLGELQLGPKRSGLPYTSDEVELLRLAAAYLAGSLRLAAAEQEQVEALDRLSAERADVLTTGSALHAALAGEAEGAAGRLKVFALGPLRVERDGELIRQWGGAKAGTRQAEALFAFLLDRGERGAGKDEIVELIWPDVDLDRADLAFHRTLGGLRTTLEPGRRGGNRGQAITFHNDRYHLDPALIAWNDVTAFEAAMAAAGASGEPHEALAHLEHARSLYRGDYLDDCPFYGDSEYVEERRALLRGRFVDLLLALGDRYEARGDRPAAAACFRQARLVAGNDLPPADEALTRLGAAT